MSDEEIRNLADEISFRLLTTNNHDDYEWLLNKLKEINK